MQTRVRQQQARMLEPQLTPEKKIQIKWARPPALFPRSVPPKLHLNGLQLIKQPQSGISRCQSAGCTGQNNCVGIGLLTRGTTDRRGLNNLRTNNASRISLHTGFKQNCQARHDVSNRRGSRPESAVSISAQAYSKCRGKRENIHARKPGDT